ncbi:MAG: hypothetical protein OEY01_15860 [Desulfobulbaceae bacterium]|nr:hypothetical protein [Desulfobulbaceae bacterium]
MTKATSKQLPLDVLLPQDKADEIMAWADEFFPMVKRLKIKVRKRMAAQGLIAPDEIYGPAQASGGCR